LISPAVCRLSTAFWWPWPLVPIALHTISPDAVDLLDSRRCPQRKKDVMSKLLGGLCCVAVVATLAWLSSRSSGDGQPDRLWKEVAPGVLRSPGWPAGYALVSGEQALLIDAPGGVAELKAQGVRKIEGVLLTHHHRDTCAAAAGLLADK